MAGFVSRAYRKGFFAAAFFEAQADVAGRVQRDDDTAEFRAVAIDFLAAARESRSSAGSGSLRVLRIEPRGIGNHRAGVGSFAVEVDPILVIAAMFALIDFALDVRHDV